MFKKISKTIKFRKTASDKQIISFIKNIKEKEFISNRNINKKNKIILNWIKKCEIFDTDTFKNRYILSERKY